MLRVALARSEREEAGFLAMVCSNQGAQDTPLYSPLPIHPLLGDVLVLCSRKWMAT